LISAPFVIPGLDPGIHVDGRDKPGHDGEGDDSTGAELALALDTGCICTGHSGPFTDYHHGGYSACLMTE